MQNSDSPYSLIAELDKALVSSDSRPPLHLWHPEVVKDIDMEIRTDGAWFYMGSAIKRPRLTRLFSSVMRKEGSDYFLVTPVEKCRIRVADAPFLAVLLEMEKDALKLTTNMGDEVVLSASCPLRVTIDSKTQEPSLYVTVRDDLEAKLNRNVYYQLMERLEEQSHNGKLWHGVTSQSDFLPIIASEDLNG